MLAIPSICFAVEMQPAFPHSFCHVSSLLVQQACLVRAVVSFRGEHMALNIYIYSYTNTKYIQKGLVGSNWNLLLICEKCVRHMLCKLKELLYQLQ